MSADTKVIEDGGPKHTPGEWQFDGQQSVINNNHFYVVGPPSNLAVANVWMGSKHSEANARLIAAAPDMLEACRECLKAVDDAYESTGHFKVAKTSEQRMKIEAAIAKAEGK